MITFAQHVARWLEDQKPRLDPDTWVGYEVALRRHWLPGLGALALDAISRRRIRDLLKAALRRGRKGGSARTDLRVLGACLEDAVIDEVLPANPARGAGKGVLPSAKLSRRRALREPQVQALLAAAYAEGVDFFELVAFLILTGVRISEALGTVWTDIDLRAGRYTVERQWRHGKVKRRTKNLVYQTTDIGDDLSAVLTLRRVRMPDAVYVFENPKRRKPWSYHAVYDRMTRTRERAGLVDRIVLHQLRHTYGTTLMQYAPTEYVQRQMRHQTIQTTVDVYANAREHRNLPAVNAMTRAVVQRAWPAGVPVPKADAG